MAKLHDQRRLTCNSHYLIFRTTSDELMAYLNISWQRCSVKPCWASELDLNGINTRYQARLNAYGIHTPMEFFQASLDTLKKQVFQSINGYYWYLRLRGYYGERYIGDTHKAC